MPIPSGDSAAAEARPDQIHAVALLSRAPVPPQMLPACCCPQLPTQGCVPAMSLAHPAGPKGDSQAATTAAEASAAQHRGYGN